MKENKNQINFLTQGYDRGQCLFDKAFPCTHYFAVITMQECDGIDCDRECCKGCTEECGYRCNAESDMKAKESKT